MLAGIDLLLGEVFALVDRRQTAFVITVVALLAIFLLVGIGGDETVETDHRADGTKTGLFAVLVGKDFHRGAFDFGRGHLARNAALPDQVVKAQLIGIEVTLHLIRRAVEIGRADRFVRFLGVLGLGGIETRLFRDVTVAELLADGKAGGIDRFRRHLHAVGTHIGDQTDGLAADIDAFIKLLRHLHGARGGKAHARGGRLLQRRCGEGRAGIALDGLRLDAVDHVGRAFQQRLQPVRIFAGLDRTVLQPLAVSGNQLGLELVTARGLQKRADIPVLFGNETLDLGFAVTDETQRNGLHTTGGTRAGQLAPQNRRQVETDEIVERTAGEIGVDQRHVDVARVRHGVQHRLLGDGVEDHALHRLVAENALLLQKIENVPGNGFAFAIRVGCEKEAVGGFYRIGNILHALGGGAVDFPGHFEILVGQHRSVLGRKIPHMAKGCKNLIARAKILVDRLGFGRRFYDDDIHIVFLWNWSVNMAGSPRNAAIGLLYISTWTGNARGSRGKADFITPR
ncbi:hypothetical protein D3C71_559620 [compost metagenome]